MKCSSCTTSWGSCCSGRSTTPSSPHRRCCRLPLIEEPWLQEVWGQGAARWKTMADAARGFCMFGRACGSTRCRHEQDFLVQGSPSSTREDAGGSWLLLGSSWSSSCSMRRCCWLLGEKSCLLDSSAQLLCQAGTCSRYRARLQQRARPCLRPLTPTTSACRPARRRGEAPLCWRQPRRSSRSHGPGGCSWPQRRRDGPG
mmetsp:Transcript_19109/g.62997  ORF Transcript_19109/g.62997 Transcript_19109/m.62997 type:complete len:200 (+) Transcript_19109:119-718(+)